MGKSEIENEKIREKEEEEEERSKKEKMAKGMIEFIKTMTLSVFVAFLITRIVVPSVVVGESMYPTFHDKDYLIVNKVAYLNDLPKDGDVILFNSELGEGKILIKRVIAREGEHLIINNGEVYVDDNKIEEPYINENNFEGAIDMIIPEGTIFVMGDNRNHSLDSRSYSVGLIEKNEIIGKPFVRLLPLSAMGFIGK